MRDTWYTGYPPHEREHYLITDDVGNLQIAYWTDSSPILGDASGMWRWVGLVQHTYVVAWRPLPLPYKEDKTDDR